MQGNPFEKSKNYCTFYIVRHGETQWNVESKIQGQGDSPLTKKGLGQIGKTALLLQNIKFDAIYSSDLLRAKKTAEIIALEHKLAVQTTKLLRERHYGHLNGKPIKVLSEIYKIYDKLSKQERFKYKISEDIESDEQVVSRFIIFVREIAVGYPSRKILVATHGGLMRALLIHLGWATYETFFTHNIENAGYIKLLSDGIDFFVKETKGIKRPEDDT